jgi:hypothetical protein
MRVVGLELLVSTERSDVNLSLRVLLLGPRLNPKRVTSQGGIIYGTHETRCCASNVVDFTVLVLYMEEIGTSQSRYWPCTVKCKHLEHVVLLGSKVLIAGGFVVLKSNPRLPCVEMWEVLARYRKSSGRRLCCLPGHKGEHIRVCCHAERCTCVVE